MRMCGRLAIAVSLLTNGINKGNVPFQNPKSIKLKGGSNPEITNIQGKASAKRDTSKPIPKIYNGVHYTATALSPVLLL
jgi:hypothetical protein